MRPHPLDMSLSPFKGKETPYERIEGPAPFTVRYFDFDQHRRELPWRLAAEL